MSEFPKEMKLRLGTKVFKAGVVESNVILTLNGRVCTGIIDCFQNTIDLSPGKSYETTTQTLFHELFHGLAWIWRVNLDEDAIDHLASGTLQMLIDNPKLDELIAELRKEQRNESEHDV